MTNEQLVLALQGAMGPNLVSVILYGSAAAGDFVPGLSGHDILIIAERLGAAELAASAGTLRDWQRAGNPLPQLFTPAELVAAADVFPIELLDMQQSRRVLVGADPLADLKIDMQHYRSQLEREWKVRLQLLRRQLSAAQTVPEKAQAATAMEGALARLLVVAENYPDLKANQNFRDLQFELSGTENRISVERQRYNETVRAYNTRVRQMPTSLVAAFFGFQPSDAYFDAAPAANEAPKVEF